MPECPVDNSRIDKLEKTSIEHSAKIAENYNDNSRLMKTVEKIETNVEEMSKTLNKLNVLFVVWSAVLAVLILVFIGIISWLMLNASESKTMGATLKIEQATVTGRVDELSDLVKSALK